VQLTPATDTVASRHFTGTRPLARLDNPALAGAVAFLAWLGFVLARWLVWAHGQITLFIMSGVVYSHPDQMSPRISHVPLSGYDGQFYYRFALNPVNWQPTAYGITVDRNYRYTRIGYPVVAWIASLGHASAVPVVLVAVNLVFVAAIAWLGAIFARDSGRHALWGLLFAAYFGLVISVGRDTSEPLADACMLAALLLYRRRRWVWAAILLAYGVITNEPVLIMALGIFITRGGDPPDSPVRAALTRCPPVLVRRSFLATPSSVRIALRRAGRVVSCPPRREDLVWALPAAAYAVLQVLEKVLVPGKAGTVSDVGNNITLPFWALGRGLVTGFRGMSWTHLGLYDFNLIEFIALAFIVIAALLALRASTAPVHERAGFACFVLIEMVMASWQFWGGVFSDGRTYVESFLMAIVILLATPDRAGEEARWWQVVTNRRLSCFAAVTVAVLVLVARRRILFE
jgi:hypothetical protein